MIARNIVDEIQRLLLENRYSQRKIALRLGVSRGTVNSIATGKRSVHAAGKGENTENSGLTLPAGVPQRCPACGAKVLMPCLACQIRELMRRKKIAHRRSPAINVATCQKQSLCSSCNKADCTLRHARCGR